MVPKPAGLRTLLNNVVPKPAGLRTLLNNVVPKPAGLRTLLNNVVPKPASLRTLLNNVVPKPAGLRTLLNNAVPKPGRSLDYRWRRSASMPSPCQRMPGVTPVPHQESSHFYTILMSRTLSAPAPPLLPTHARRHPCARPRYYNLSHHPEVTESVAPSPPQLPTHARRHPSAPPRY